MAAEGVYRARAGQNFAAMMHAAGNEVLIARPQRNSLTIDDDDVATLHDDHVFFVVMSVARRACRLSAGPKRHLASIDSVENIAIDPRCRLMRCGDPVCRSLHELWEFAHGASFSHVKKGARDTAIARRKHTCRLSKQEGQSANSPCPRNTVTTEIRALKVRNRTTFVRDGEFQIANIPVLCRLAPNCIR
jgi:hypothetical protein